MCSRAAAVLALLVSCSAAGAVVTACTTETEPAQDGDAADAGREASTRRDSGSTEQDSAAPPTAAECFAACDAKHAAGRAKDEAIDTCWTQSCKGPCIDGTGPVDAGVADAADGGDAGGDDAGDAGSLQCSNGVETGDDACDDCTVAFCCGAWDGCFDDQECSDLNECLRSCPEE